LTFDVPNYHTASRLYQFDNPNPGVSIKGRKHFYNNETVVLQALGGPEAELQTRSNTCRWSPSNGSRILDLRTQVFPNKNTAWYVETIPSTATLPGMYVELVPTSDTVVSEKLADGDWITPKDAYLELVVDDGCTSSGLCMVPRNGRGNRDIAISMKAAPESGYQKRIRITPNMLDNRHGTVNEFFYFKILGVYGKGTIEHCEYHYRPANGLPPQNESAQVTVEFKVQTDGSRNVLTRE
jgi:hypothetical protein